MTKIGNHIQTGDYTSEKHVPHIEVPENIKAQESFNAVVTVGKEVAHPNTAGHHIRWIKLYFKGEKANFPIELGSNIFSAHGASDKGTDQAPVITNPLAAFNIEIREGGILLANSYCNIHGLWESALEIKLS